MSWWKTLLSWVGWGSTELDGQVSKVQVLTVKLCKFLPTASSVAAILTANNPAVVGVSAVATAICGAVTRRSHSLLGDAAPKPEVNGIVVEGEYVKD